jgi:hypothetical protein
MLPGVGGPDSSSGSPTSTATTSRSTATSSSTASSSSKTTSPSTDPTPSSSKPSHAGAIAGGVVAGIATLVLLGLAGFAVHRRRDNAARARYMNREKVDLIGSNSPTPTSVSTLPSQATLRLYVRRSPAQSYYLACSSVADSRHVLPLHIRTPMILQHTRHRCLFLSRRLHNSPYLLPFGRRHPNVGLAKQDWATASY